MPIKVLFIGRDSHPDFQIAIRWLSRKADLQCVTNVLSAKQYLLRSPRDTELVILGQSRPGQFSNESVNELRGIAPLCRWVSILGSWCEGEMRSGTPWNGVVRSYWHHWPARFARDWDSWDSGTCPSWGQPTTVSPDERLDS